MRLMILSALLVATAVAMPHGGAKRGMQKPAATPMPTSMSMPMKKDLEHPVASSMSMSMPMKRDMEHPATSSMSMSMPMKREISMASATPTSSMRVESPTKAEKMMMLF